MIGRLQIQPVADTRAYNCQRSPQFTRCTKEIRDNLIERKRWRERYLRFGLTHIHTTSVSKLNPALPFQFPIARAYRIGMKMKSPRQFSCAWQPLPGSQ